MTGEEAGMVGAGLGAFLMTSYATWKGLRRKGVEPNAPEAETNLKAIDARLVALELSLSTNNTASLRASVELSEGVEELRRDIRDLREIIVDVRAEFRAGRR